jgi:thioesterase domain-containing protein
LAPKHAVACLEGPPLTDISSAAPSIQELAAEYADRFRPADNVVIGGWSFGGVVALEVAHILRRGGTGVGRIIVIDMPAPVPEGVTRPIDDVSDAELLAALAEQEAHRLARPFHVATDDSFGAVAERMIDAGLAPRAAPREWFLRLVGGYRGRLRSLQEYTPREAIDVPIAVFRASKAESALPGVFDGNATDPTWGWHRLTSVEARGFAVAGGHADALSGPPVARIVEEVRRGLACSPRTR